MSQTVPFGVDELATGATQLGLSLSEAQLDTLLQYAAMLLKWNQVYNLTAIRSPAEVLTHHLLDSLAAVQPLRRYLETQGLSDAAVLDVGSGGGLPGIVLTIACPELRVTCVDTVSKKAAFIQQAAIQLPRQVMGGRLASRHARVESLDTPFDVVCSRAFASLPDFTQWSSKALKPGGAWMAMKGQVPDAEIAALPAGIEVFHVEQLAVPSLEAQRCIVWLRDRAPPGIA
jgi:16S rRNA (guanine527-N7)-methyltransferase